MNKDRGYSDDSFDESEFQDHGFGFDDEADETSDESDRRHRKRRGNLSSRQRIEDFQEAKWLRSRLEDWDDWSDERLAL